MKNLITLFFLLPLFSFAQINVYTGHLDQFGNFDYWGLPDRGSLNSGDYVQVMHFMTDTVCLTKTTLVSDCNEDFELSTNEPYWFSYSDTIADGSSYNSYPDGSQLFYISIDSAKFKSFFCNVLTVEKEQEQDITGYIYDQYGTFITSLKMANFPDFLAEAEKGVYIVRYGTEFKKYAKLLN